MDWLSDEALEEFLDTPLLRVETTKIFRVDVGTAWVVLNAENRKYLGTVTRSGKGYYAFTVNDAEGMRVGSFETALRLIELSGTSRWIEDPEHRRYQRDNVILPEES